MLETLTFVFGLLAVVSIVLLVRFINKHRLPEKPPPAETKDDDEVELQRRQPTKDELALGWRVSEDKATGKTALRMTGVHTADRATHFYIIGATGMGKTKFLLSLINQDTTNGAGFGVIDPHGDLIEEIKGHLLIDTLRETSKRYWPDDNTRLHKAAVLIEPTNPTATVCFNPLEPLKGVSSAELASELVQVFQKIWGDSWGPRMADILRNTFIALSESGLTLVDLPDFLTDEDFRHQALARVQHPTCLARFRQFNAQSAAMRNSMVEPVLNKVNALISDERLRHLFMSPKSTFNLREIIDNQKILLVNLNKGRLKDSADLLGSLLMSKIQMAAFARTDQTPDQRKPFYLYVDEFQNLATESFIDTLSEARKYRLSLVLAHQNLSLPERLQASILSNCGLHAYFRVSRKDAQVLAKESLSHLYQSEPGAWEAQINKLQELEPRHFIVKNKAAGGAVELYTDNVPGPWEIAERPQDYYMEVVARSEPGKHYLRERAELEQAYQEQRQQLEEVVIDEELETFKEVVKVEEPETTTQE